MRSSLPFVRSAALFLPLVLAACSGNEPTAASAPAAPPTTSSLSADSLAALDRYEAQSRTLIGVLSAEGEIDVQQVDTHADALVSTAVSILPDFLALRPHCRPYLEAALGLVGTRRSMSPDEIETGYHKDAALPKIDNAAACYHMKDLIVHPITAQALIAEDADHRVRARQEIDEVIAHLSVVRATR